MPRRNAGRRSRSQRPTRRHRPRHGAATVTVRAASRRRRRPTRERSARRRRPRNASTRSRWSSPRPGTSSSCRRRCRSCCCRYGSRRAGSRVRRSRELLIRIYPDEVHSDTFEPELTADEETWGDALLAADGLGDDRGGAHGRVGAARRSVRAGAVGVGRAGDRSGADHAARPAGRRVDARAQDARSARPLGRSAANKCTR